MKILKHYLPLLILTSFIGFSSCTKKCVVEGDDKNSGAIIQDVIFYPQSGYMTSSMAGNYVITASHSYAGYFEVSFNGGDRTPVNYMNYNILCYPTNANCNAYYDRTVTIDPVAETVVYKIVVTQCSACKEVRTCENYVLVPTFPSSYAVSYDVSYVNKD